VFGSAEDKVKIKEAISSIAYGTAQTNLDVVNFDNDDDHSPNVEEGENSSRSIGMHTKQKNCPT
jgi:hypothetical protein